MVSLAGCALTDPTAICELADHEVRIFPVDTTADVPVNVAPRALLSASRAAAVDAVLIEEISGEPVSVSVIETATEFGTVLELLPLSDLAAATEFRVELVDRSTGVPEASSLFVTGGGPELALASASGDSIVQAVAKGDRECCGPSGCRDGSVVTVPAIDRGGFWPHLMLLEIEEAFNDQCGAASRLLAVVPVLHESAARTSLVAETDRVLSGCFRVVVRDQLGSAGEPGGVVCSDGFRWEPRAPSEECRQPTGCALGPPGPSRTGGGLLLLTLATIAFRRRG